MSATNLRLQTNLPSLVPPCPTPPSPWGAIHHALNSSKLQWPDLFLGGSWLDLHVVSTSKRCYQKHRKKHKKGKFWHRFLTCFFKENLEAWNWFPKKYLSTLHFVSLWPSTCQRSELRIKARHGLSCLLSLHGVTQIRTQSMQAL